MRVVLPCEADAAEGLHAILGVRERSAERERGCRGDCERGTGIVEIVGRGRRVPHRRACELHARQHLGAPVLHAQELTDRTSELHAHLRVVGRGVDTPLRDADRLGREQRGGDQAHALVAEIRKLSLGRGSGGTRCGVEVDARQPASQIDTLHFLGAHGRGVERVPRAVDRADDHVGGGTAGRQRGAVECDRTGELAGRELRKELVGRGTAVGEQQRGDDRGRNVGSGRARSPELLDHDGLLEETRAAASVCLVDVEADPARLGQSVPEGRADLPRSVQRVADDTRIDVVVDETADGAAQVLVFLCDPDRHSSIVARA